ncbi:MAG: hypothetical protein C0505_01700 [Leptothrix sp. (in: Bacteria)]|nr:hypothetical protein [Leptothrix sp. (in: b-proteobacteria)]
MYHLYLHCQGMVAAGPGAASPADAGVTTRAATAGVAPADNDRNDKNSANADENIQARTRSVRSAAKRGDAQLELALRDNNMSMLVQRSNVLPTGQRLTYQATQTHYTATFLPQMAGAAFRKWGEAWLFGWYPPFQKMTAARLAIDRQTGVLEGEIVGPAGEVLGLIDMQCEPKRNEDAAAPRF